MPSFSDRNNLRRAVPINVREDAPSQMRTFLFDTISYFMRDTSVAFNLVYLSVGQVPPVIAHQYQRQLLRSLVMQTEWFHVYDIVETIYHHLATQPSGKANQFLELVNEFFQKNGYGYTLMGRGEVVARGDEAFETAVQTSGLTLSAAGLSTADGEIHAALEDLSRRPNADLTGAIQHAMAGLECAAKEVALEPKLELGKIAKRHPELFPAPLGDAVAQIYGFASERGRHLREGGEPEFPEAELVVGLAAIIATYLARKKDT